MKKIAIITTTILYFLNSSANADPSGLILKLMNTQVTMFSYGMDKLDIFVKGQVPKNWSGWADYNWDSNQINITMRKFGNSQCINEIDCLAEVKKELSEVTEIWCITNEESNIKCGEFDLITPHFNSNGFATRNFYDGKNSSDATKEIKNFVNIKATLTKNKINYNCTKKLIEKNIYCINWPL